MKHPKKAERHIGRNVVSTTMKEKSIVRKFQVIKITKVHLKNLTHDI